VKTKLLETVEGKSLKKDIPHFETGDTVDVYCRIKEGDKERTQVFTGTVIARRGRGINETFTVRRIVGNEGVERIFPLPEHYRHKTGKKRQKKTSKTILPAEKGRQIRSAGTQTHRPHGYKIKTAGWAKLYTTGKIL